MTLRSHSAVTDFSSAYTHPLLDVNIHLNTPSFPCPVPFCAVRLVPFASNLTGSLLQVTHLSCRKAFALTWLPLPNKSALSTPTDKSGPLPLQLDDFFTLTMKPVKSPKRIYSENQCRVYDVDPEKKEQMFHIQFIAIAIK